MKILKQPQQKQELLMRTIIPLLAIFITACATPNNSPDMTKEPATPITSSDLTLITAFQQRLTFEGAPLKQ